MAIRIRRGNQIDFDKNKLVQGELAIVLDAGELHFCYGAGNIKRLQTREDLVELLGTAPEAYEALKDVITELGNAPEEVLTILANFLDINTIVENADGATQRANNIAGILEQKLADGEFKGEQGEQGLIGDTGFSPTVTEEINTSTEYKLKVTNENDSFVTPNLKGADGLGVGDMKANVYDPQGKAKDVFSQSAEEVEYDNTESELVSTKVQGAIDEIKGIADSAFQSASNGKTLIKNAITGVDPEVIIPTDPTFAQLATAIGDIETGIDTTIAVNPIAPNKVLDGYKGFVNDNMVTGNIPSKGAETITPGTTNKTIASGQYLSGAQTIKGDANLIPSKLPLDLTLFGVQGIRSLGVPGATGRYVPGTDTKKFYQSGGARQRPYIQIGGLTFKATFIMVRATSSVTPTQKHISYYTLYSKRVEYPGTATIRLGPNAELISDKESSANGSQTDAYVTASGFLLPLLYTTATVSEWEWVAIDLPYV